jgi:hypothetical protein
MFDLRQLSHSSADFAPYADGIPPERQCSGWLADNVQFNSPLWTRACSHASRRSKTMLWTICVILLVLWALGMATSYTASGLIHILLVIALVVMVIRLIQGRRIVG